MDERTRAAIGRALRARGRVSGEPPEVARIGEMLDRAGGRARCHDDADYPPRLRSLPRPPDVLFLAGPWDHDGPIVALVGSRNATPDGLEVARGLAEDLAIGGVAVVSGLAQGIDAAAHAGALDAGGRSGAALGTGLERCYPRGHESLQAALAGSLGILSEVLPGDPPRAATFASRNRLLAALADAVVLVQGDATSGALLTVAAAEALGRPVGAVPWDPREALAASPHALIRAGRATLVRDAGDVAALLGRSGLARAGSAERTDPASHGSARPPGRRAASSDPVAPDAPSAPSAPARLLAALRRRPEPLDDVAARAGLPISVAAAALLALELDGRARREPGGRYRLGRGG